MSGNKGIYKTLERAVRGGDAAGVEKALSGADGKTKSKLFTLRDSFDNTLLHTAVERGYADVLEALLDGGADIEAKGNEGARPLAAACGFGRVECAKTLLRRGAEVDARDDLSRTALMSACSNARFESVADCARLLLRSGADTEAKDIIGMTPLDCLPAGAEDHGTAERIREVRQRVSGLLALRSDEDDPYEYTEDDLAEFGPHLRHTFAPDSFEEAAELLALCLGPDGSSRTSWPEYGAVLDWLRRTFSSIMERAWTLSSLESAAVAAAGRRAAETAVPVL